MKSILILLTVVAFAGCSKESKTVEAPGIRAMVTYAGNPAADGFGWVLQVTQDSTVIPSNLPEDYKRQDLVVNVAYKQSEKTFPCRCASPKYMVDIISISRVNTTGQ